MKRSVNLMVAAALSIACTTAFAAPAIVVNPKNASKVTSQDAKDLFMGKSKSFSDGTSAIPVFSKSGKAREGFLSDVLGKSESQYKSTWATLVFTGKAQPPKEVDSDDEVLKLVAANPSMIGVIDSTKVDSSVKDVAK